MAVRGGCFSAGTKITFAGGEKMAIEKQRAGLKQSQALEKLLPTGGEIFGINGEMPFAINPKPSLLDDRWMEKP